MCAVCITLIQTHAETREWVGAPHTTTGFLRRAAAHGYRVQRQWSARTHTHSLIRRRPHTETCERRVNRILHPPANYFLVLFCLLVTYRCSFVNARLPHIHTHTPRRRPRPMYILLYYRYILFNCNCVMILLLLHYFATVIVELLIRIRCTLVFWSFFFFLFIIFFNIMTRFSTYSQGDSPSTVGGAPIFFLW